MDIYSPSKPYTYIIRLVTTGQVYYGMRSANTVSPEKDLWIRYFTSSKKIKKLLAQYGKDAFTCEVRRTFDTHEQAACWEKKVLTRMRVLSKPDIWLNDSISGTLYNGTNRKGQKHSDEARRKMSEARKGKVSYIPTAEQKLASSLRQKGIPKSKGWHHSNETKASIGIKHRGKVVSDDTRRKLSEAAKVRPIRQHSEETKQKMRESAKLNHLKNPRTHSEETKRKIRAAAAAP